MELYWINILGSLQLDNYNYNCANGINIFINFNFNDRPFILKNNFSPIKPCRHYRITTFWGTGLPLNVDRTTRFGSRIFNGLFQITSLSNGIDQFIYIAGLLIFALNLEREISVFKYALQLNKAVPSALSDGALKNPLLSKGSDAIRGVSGVKPPDTLY